MKLLRKLLFPFSIIYAAITALRNRLYDLGWLKSHSYNLPIICVGNLSTGGTGKSPMVEFLVNTLKQKRKVAVLSRGYKRKTKGFRKVLVTSTVSEVGDEPLQFKKKFPEVDVAVCEIRSNGIDQLKSNADIIILDDAFQHRRVNASLSILLTSYGDLYVDDYVLPTGNLREPRSGANRAEVLVVTKCPETLSNSEMNKIERKLKPKKHQQVYFSKIVYSKEIIGEGKTESINFLQDIKFTLVTGIANPNPFISFLENHDLNFSHKSFPDHHDFSSAEIDKLDQEGVILTTEKDYMRLQPFINKAKLYYLPITISFLNGDTERFIKRIES